MYRRHRLDNTTRLLWGCCNIITLTLISTELTTCSSPITGHPPNDGPSDGAEDEQAAFESAEYAARGAAPEQVVASEYLKVRDVHLFNNN